MPADDKKLERVANAVSDGSSVDWSAEDEANPELSGPLRGLRLVESVAAAHREASGADGSKRMDTISVKTTMTPMDGNPASQEEELFRWGELRVLEQLGVGGFGEVYRAYEPGLDREVALKLRREDRAGVDPFEGRFLQEARILARIRHEHIVTVHGAGEHDGRVGLWTDLLRGKTLEEQLEEHGRLGAREAAVIGIDLCQALAAVHAEGLIHRDVKTSNVMREEGGRIVLMDFGSVSEWKEGDRAKGEVSGTPLAMAPEILRGETATPSSDLYSLGVLLYRLVSGQYPVNAEKWSELREKHEKGQRTSLREARPDLPPAFVQVVERAIAPAPRDRFEGAGAMETALASSIGTVKPSVDEAAGWWNRRRILAAAAVAVVAALAGVLGPRLFVTPAFDVEAHMFREGEASDERLASGAGVKPGDKLFLEVEGSERMHVYVLNEDEQGEEWLLFPMPGWELDNPLEPGDRHRLPGSFEGHQMNWEVTSAGGKEHFLVIASRKPLEWVEEKLASIPPAGRGRPVQIAVPPELRRIKTRGVGGAAPTGTGGTNPSDRPAFDGLAATLTDASAEDSGIYVREIVLDNPVR